MKKANALMMKKALYYLLVTALFLLSFRLFSALYYPLLNSDNGVNVLMIHYFSLPHDLYFWGQDRMGSLVALIAQPLFQGLGLSAIASESIAHYFILLLGFLAFASFFKSYFLKIIFAIVWFFPPMRLIDVTQFSFGLHYSIIAIACYLLTFLKITKVQENGLSRHLILISVILLLIIAVWVSDMALISVFLFGVIHLFYLIRERNKVPVFRQPDIYYGFGGVIIAFLFIHYAKSAADVRSNYASFSDFETTLKTLGVFIESISDQLFFRTGELFTGIYTYLVFLFLGVLVFQLKKFKENPSSSRWIWFFLLDTMFLFGVIMISEWTIINDVPRRYFTCTYIAFSFFILLVYDNIELNRRRKMLVNSLLLITVIAGGISAPYAMEYAWPKTLRPKVEVVREFERLGKIGVISNYWNSYVTSVSNPEMIMVTPHEKAEVRNYEIVEEVFRRENIYIIRDGWMETFPDTLIQFDHTLVRVGEEIYVGDCSVCRYELIDN